MTNRFLIIVFLGSLGYLLASPSYTVTQEPQSLFRSSSSSTNLSVPFSEPTVAYNSSTREGVVEVNLTAGSFRISLIEGKETEVYAYNGSVPGPTIIASEGDQVIVHFKNNLPEPTTIHWHGLHIPADQDGTPMTPIAPGESHDYTFKIPPRSAGTYWYHPHPDQASAAQVTKGLAGAFIVREARNPLPASISENLVMLSDNKFDSSGQIAPDSDEDRMNGREGNAIFVNGKQFPVMTVRSGEVRRFRIINASPARYYQLQIPGQTFYQIGTDGGLFERPIRESNILLAPGERVELLVQFQEKPGTVTELQSLPYDRGTMAMTGGNNMPMPSSGSSTPISLFQIRYSKEPPVTAPSIPEVLRPVPPLSTEQAKERQFIFTENMHALDFRINDQKFDLNRIDTRAKLGATEIWNIRNNGDMDHDFHLHGFSFQVLDRNGVPEPFPAWKDTINVPRKQNVRFVVKFDDFPGLHLYHCHILEHEDLGMMGVLQVE